MGAQRGFTIIELAIVIAVIAIMASFSVGQYQARRGDARVKKTLSDLKALSDVAHSYWIRGGAPTNVNTTSMPGEISELMPPGYNGVNAWGLPFFINITATTGTVTTCVGAEAQGIPFLDPRISNIGACGGAGPGGVRVSLTRRFFFDETGYRMKLERALLHQQP